MRTFLNKCSLHIKFFLSVVPILAASALMLPGCSNNGEEKPVVVGTTTQVADLVREVAVDRVRVVSIMRPNVDPHEFEPRARDVEAISRARVVFTSGAGIDNWADRLIKSSGTNARKVDIFNSLPVKLKPDEAGGADSKFDPHWWGSPEDATAAVEQIEATLSEEFPSYARAFKKNARKLRQRVDELDRKIAKCLQKVPRQKRKLISYHGAYRYFTVHFGLKYVGTLIPSLSTEAQPSAGDIHMLINKIRAEEIPAIFTESSSSTKLAEAVAANSGAKVHGPLYIDSLGQKDSGADTWISSTRHNALVILKGLGGNNDARCLK